MSYMREFLVLLCILSSLLVVGYGLYRSAVAIVLPWIRRDVALKARAVSLLLCGFFATLIALAVNHFDSANRGETAAFAILNGDMRTRIVRMEIEGQQRKVICTDPAVLRYLEDCFRNSNRRKLPSGYSYEIKLFFEDGSRFSGDSYWCNEGFQTRVFGDAYFPPTHDIELQSPIPDTVRRMVEFLNEMGHSWKPRELLILNPEG
jgi:hypothetical protein